MKLTKLSSENVVAKIRAVFSEFAVFIGFIVAMFFFELCIVFISISNNYHFNETQIMYFSSTNAQVVAALFGLTITGYVFFAGNMNDEYAKSEDKGIDEIWDDLNKKYSKLILAIGVIVFLCVFLCLINIFLSNRIILGGNIINNITLANSILFALSSIAMIIYFISLVVNPQRLENFSNSRIKIIEENIKQGHNGDDGSPGNLQDFLSSYNEIEALIKKKYAEVSKSQYKLREMENMYSKIKFLQQMNAISGNLSGEVDTLRKYRNYVVHSTDMSVDKQMVRNAKIINDMLNKEFDKPE